LGYLPLCLFLSHDPFLPEVNKECKKKMHPRGIIFLAFPETLM